MSSHDELVQLEPAPGVAADPGGEEARRRAAQAEEQARLRRRVGAIRHTVIVLSGKGGVGKSTVAVHLAAAARRAGLRVGLLDVDIHGPSLPTMLGVESAPVVVVGEALVPVEVDGVKVMSMGLLLGNRDEAVVWRGPMKMKAIAQFLADVEWGELDLLVVDAPPGTGDEPLSVCQLLEHPDGAIVVTTPQEVAITAVRKSVTFCRRLGLPVLGVVENMSGFVCPGCGLLTDVFGAGAGERMATSMGVPFLGKVPIHPQITSACDAGRGMEAAGDPVVVEAFERIAEPVVRVARASETDRPSPPASSLDGPD